jgi:hypothetical protein
MCPAGFLEEAELSATRMQLTLTCRVELPYGKVKYIHITPLLNTALQHGVGPDS